MTHHYVPLMYLLTNGGMWGSVRPGGSTQLKGYYGVGDGDTIANLFASYPQTITTAPWPHRSQGLRR